MALQIIRMKELREKQGMNQLELAKRMNVARSSIAMWEAGRSSPSLDMLVHLCEILGCTVGYLLGTEDEPCRTSDGDMWELREELRSDPNRRTLLSLAKNGSAYDVRQVAAIVDALRATNPDFYDGDDPA